MTDAEPTPVGPVAVTRAAVDEAARLDVAMYAAVARTPTPTLDRFMSGLSSAADHSKLNLAAAGLLVLAGGRRGRRGALYGLAALGATSAGVNLVAKPFGRRHRPDRSAQDVPIARHVPMPSTSSFPSGHSAAAFAFATGVGHVNARAALPLRGLAAMVAYSRVHTGVHYPGDVVAGALLGEAIAQIVSRGLDRRGHYLR